MSALSGAKAGCGERLGAGRHIQHDDIGRDGVGAGIVARQPRQRRIDLDQHQLDPGHASRHRQPRGADAGAEIDHAIAGPRRRRRRQQHGVVAGAVARPGLAQPQLPAKKCILGDVRRTQLSHRPAVHGRDRHR